MKKTFKSIIATALATVMSIGSFLNPELNTKAASYRYGYELKISSNYGTIKNLTVPTQIKRGDVCSISGEVTPDASYVKYGSGYNYKIGIAVYNTSVHRLHPEDGQRAYYGERNKISYASAESPTLTTLSTYNLAKLDNYIYFSSLPAGEYMYTIYLRNYSAIGDVANTVRELYTCSFIIYDSTNTFFKSSSYYGSQFIVSDWKTPSTIKYGKSYGLNADINVLYKNYTNLNFNTPNAYSDPKYVQGEIYGATPGSITMKKFDSGKITLSTKHYFGKNKNIFSVPLPQEVDYAMVFGDLPRGTYIYKLTVYYELGGQPTAVAGTTSFIIS